MCVCVCVCLKHSLIIFCAMILKFECTKRQSAVKESHMEFSFLSNAILPIYPNNWVWPTWLLAFSFNMKTSNCSSSPKPEINMAHSWLGQVTELSYKNLQIETLKGISRLLLQQEEKDGLIPWLFFSEIEILFLFSPMD